MSMIQKSSVNIDERTREKLIVLLNSRVGLFTELQVQTKLAHWNVRGPHFLAYHELFDSVTNHLLEAQDLMAERASTLGGYAGMTLPEVMQNTLLPPWPIEIRQDSKLIRVIGELLSKAADLIREDINRAASIGDADTADLFTEISRQLDKDLWFVEAHYLV